MRLARMRHFGLAFLDRARLKLIRTKTSDLFYRDAYVHVAKEINSNVLRGREKNISQP